MTLGQLAERFLATHAGLKKAQDECRRLAQIAEDASHSLHEAMLSAQLPLVMDEGRLLERSDAQRHVCDRGMISTTAARK
jgi:hypothetical protein